MRISDWSSDVCSSDLHTQHPRHAPVSITHKEATNNCNEMQNPTHAQPHAKHLPPNARTYSLIHATQHQHHQDPTRGMTGKRVSDRVNHGGRRIIKKTNPTSTPKNTPYTHHS